MVSGHDSARTCVSSLFFLALFLGSPCTLPSATCRRSRSCNYLRAVLRRARWTCSCRLPLACLGFDHSPVGHVGNLVAESEVSSRDRENRKNPFQQEEKHASVFGKSICIGTAETERREAHGGGPWTCATVPLLCSPAPPTLRNPMPPEHEKKRQWTPFMPPDPVIGGAGAEGGSSHTQRTRPASY
jgi:hypothetical protein